MMNDSELDKLAWEIHRSTEEGNPPAARKLIYSIQLDALRHAREVVEQNPSRGEQSGEDNSALPDLDKLIRELELK